MFSLGGRKYFIKENEQNRISQTMPKENHEKNHLRIVKVIRKT